MFKYCFWFCKNGFKKLHFVAGEEYSIKRLNGGGSCIDLYLSSIQFKKKKIVYGENRC